MTYVLSHPTGDSGLVGRENQPWQENERPGLAHRWRDLAVVAAYFSVAVVAYWNVWTAGSPSVVEPGGLDPQLNMWFLSWVPFALLHGHNPFFTTYGNYPYGVNLLTNTGETLLGVLAAPVTLMLGPVVGFNALLTTAMASSATAGYVLARRFTRWRPAAFMAGLLYGFSPYMVGQGYYHLFLLFVPLPPLIFLVLHELLVVQKWRAGTSGALLGALVCAQFFISDEILADTAVLAAAAVAVLVVMHPSAVRERAAHAGRSLAIAAAIGVVVLTAPALYALHGPAHITGTITLGPAQGNRADLLGAVVPNDDQRFAPLGLAKIGNRFAANPLENGSYLGIPLLVVLALATAMLRRVGVVAFSSVMAGVAYVLSLGSRLVVSSSPSAALASGTLLPGAIFDHIPLLDNLGPARLSLFVALFASVVLAVGLDRLKCFAGGDGRIGGQMAWSRNRPLHSRRRRLPHAAGAAAAVVVGFGALVPLVPSWPYPVNPVNTPPYFTSAMIDAVPAGSAALLYPYPAPGIDDALPMLWQASAGMRFKTPGGYFIVPQPVTGKTSEWRSTFIGTTFDELYGGVTLPHSGSLRSQLWRQLDAWRIETLIAQPVGADPAEAINFLTWLVGRPPVSSGGVEVWYHIRSTRT